MWLHELTAATSCSRVKQMLHFISIEDIFFFLFLFYEPLKETKNLQNFRTVSDPSLDMVVGRGAELERRAAIRRDVSRRERRKKEAPNESTPVSPRNTVRSEQTGSERAEEAKNEFSKKGKQSKHWTWRPPSFSHLFLHSGGFLGHLEASPGAAGLFRVFTGVFCLFSA
jgi:hypothetical protein